jgi:endonuclease/exonuclease/phosphatase family metal-dependent hydrolase
MVPGDVQSDESAVSEILVTIEANGFPERAAALAAEIVEKKPHLVGLQEVLNFTIDETNPRPPFYDYLEELLKALEARGADYRVAAVVKNLDLVFPFDINQDGVLHPIGALDRDVILARGDVKEVVVLTGLCQKVSEDGCNYKFVASLRNPLATETMPLPPIDIERGFVAIDARVDGFPVRFVNTHLELREVGPFDGLLQAAQAFELTQILAALNSELLNPHRAPIIVVGDFNSDPSDHILPGPAGPIVPPYLQLTAPAAGFVDAWTQHRPKGQGPLSGRQNTRQDAFGALAFGSCRSGESDGVRTVVSASGEAGRPKGVADQIHSKGQLHNHFTIERKRGHGFHRNPLNSLVGHVGFEPTTS